MERALIFALGVVMLGASAGCAEADPAPEIADADPWTSLDAGALSIQVTNVGNECSEDAGCNGPGARCMHVSSTATRYPGGYCTASCGASEECGPGALCPVADAIAADPTFEPRSTWAHTCYRRCSVDGAGLGGCRSGYICRSLAEAYGMKENAPAAMRETICIPVPLTTLRR